MREVLTEEEISQFLIAMAEESIAENPEITDSYPDLDWELPDREITSSEKEVSYFNY